MTTNVSISGIKAAGSTLKVKAADTTGLTNPTYVWFSTDTEQVTDVNGNLSNAITTSVLGTASSYKVTQSNIDDETNIGVVTTYKTTAGLTQTITAHNVLSTNNSQYATSSYNPDTPLPLQSLNQTHTGGISIKGTVNVGNTLTAVSTLKDKDGLGTLNYMWLSVDKDNTETILSINTSTYTVNSDDVGSKIYVSAYYTDKHGFYESADSKSTATVGYSTKKTAFDDHITVTTPNKVVTGGTGADTFIFNTINSKSFKIGDFSASQKDMIDLSNIDTNVLASGDQPFAWLDSKPTTTSEASHAVWFDSSTSTLYGSIDNDVDPEISVVLTGVTNFTIANLLL